MNKIAGLILVFVLSTSSGCASIIGGSKAGVRTVDLKKHWKTVESYDLVRYRVSDLGLDAPAALSAVYLAAKRLGLDLCPEPLGIPIRLAYSEQPDGEELMVGMKPVNEKKRGDIIYSIKVSKKQLILDVTRIEPGKRFDPRTEFIFVRPKHRLR